MATEHILWREGSSVTFETAAETAEGTGEGTRLWLTV